MLVLITLELQSATDMLTRKSADSGVFNKLLVSLHPLRDLLMFQIDLLLPTTQNGAVDIVCIQSVVILILDNQWLKVLLSP
jgi:hypothetical protein